MEEYESARAQLNETLSLGVEMLKEDAYQGLEIKVPMTVSVDATTAENQMKELIKLFEKEKSFFECPVEEVFDLFSSRVRNLISHIVVNYDSATSKTLGPGQICFKAEFVEGLHLITAAIRAHDPDSLKF